MPKLPRNLQGLFPDEYASPQTMYRATGVKRIPRRGEYYLSGAVIRAYLALTDWVTQEFWIAEPVEMMACPHCNGTGRMVNDGG